jgi:hypothetical protein
LFDIEQRNYLRPAKYLLALAFSVLVSGLCNIELRRVIFFAQKVKLGVKMMEYRMGFLDLDARRHKAGFIH